MKTVSLAEKVWDSNRLKQLGKALKTRQLFSLEIPLNIYEQYQIVKSEKYETFCASKLRIWRKNG